MESNVVVALSEYLDALDYQVEAWDHKVVKTLHNDPLLFDQFRSGSEQGKWIIYTAARYGFS